LEYNTIHPNGLNLKHGGGSKGKHNDETIQKIREKLKGCFVSKERRTKLSITKKKGCNLPMYVIEYRQNNEVKGYRVCNHPNKGEKRFTDKTLTLAQKLEKAIEYVNYLDTLKTPIPVIKTELPKYLQKYKDGYCVKYPNHHKYFVNKSLTREVKLQMALEYLATLEKMAKVQRLDGSGFMDFLIPLKEEV
jgi:hypothetical protein